MAEDEQLEVIYRHSCPVRLVQGDTEKLTDTVRREIEHHDLLVFAGRRLELEYWHETAVHTDALKIMEHSRRIERQSSAESRFNKSGAGARRKWSRTLGRLIVAHPSRDAP